MLKSNKSLEMSSINTMKQKFNFYILSKTLFSSLLFFSIVCTSLYAQEGDPVKGKSLFNANCAACHQLDKKMTGPALRKVESRLSETEGLDRVWLNAWIRNSNALIKSGDAYANKIYAEYNGSAMTAFPQFSDEDITNILAYTAQDKAVPVAAVATATQGTQAEGGVSQELVLGALAVLFGLLALGLFLVNKTLRRFASANNVEIAEAVKRKSLWKAFVNNQFLMLVVAIFFLLSSAYFVYGYLMQVGVNQGYQPIQPIHYSHKIHAGDNGIDCKYCHSSARVSKHS
jgi:mono/diheme cytochrome c family protein